MREEILSKCKVRRSGERPRIVFVSGNFNVIHPGHQRLLQFAADCGDILVVGVNPDSARLTLFSQDERVEGIRQLSDVDVVIPLSGSLRGMLEKLQPDVVVKGKEHESKINPEAEIVAAYGGKLLFGSGDTRFSSMELLKDDFENVHHSNVVHAREFLQRRKISGGSLRKAISRFKDLRVVVIGDTIIDEYITCEALGLSQEDPTIVVNPIHRRKFVGGAAIVAAHAAGLGAKVNFYSVVGRDLNAGYAAENLKNFGVMSTLLEDIGRPTTLKQRYRAREKTLLRVNELRQHSISIEMCEAILAQIRLVIKDCDLLVFSDFNYGCLPNRLVSAIVTLAKRHGVTMVADSQSSSQIGDISRFHKMKLVTPTEREARLGVSDFESGLVVLCDLLIEKSQAENVFITMAAEGLLIRGGGKGKVTDRLPALNPSPRDTAGAGDSLLIASSMVLASGGDIWHAGYLGSLAAAIQVSRVGNTPLNADELLGEIATISTRIEVAS